MSNLQPEQIVDVNGHLTTRYKKKPTDSGKPSRLPALKLTKEPKNPYQVDTNELTDALHEAAYALLDYPDEGLPQSAWRKALRDNAESNGEYALLLVVAEAKGLVPPYSIINNISPEDLSKNLASVSVTEEDMKDVFGSQWRAVTDVVMKAGNLSIDQTNAMFAGNGGNRAIGKHIIETRDMWQRVRANTKMGDIADNAAAAVLAAVPEDRHDPNDHTISRLAERGVRAVAVRDLIGSHGVTQEYYDRETAHLKRGIGKLHPSD